MTPENIDDIERDIEIATDAYLGAMVATSPIEDEMYARQKRFHAKHPGSPAPWFAQWRDVILPAMEAATAAAHGANLYQLHLRLARAKDAQEAGEGGK